jgi:hypothetical protein
MKKSLITFRVHPTLLDLLEKDAVEQHRTVSNMTHCILIEHYQRLYPEQNFDLFAARSNERKESK